MGKDKVGRVFGEGERLREGRRGKWLEGGNKYLAFEECLGWRLKKGICVPQIYSSPSNPFMSLKTVVPQIRSSPSNLIKLNRK